MKITYEFQPEDEEERLIFDRAKEFHDRFHELRTAIREFKEIMDESDPDEDRDYLLSTYDHFVYELYELSSYI